MGAPIGFPMGLPIGISIGICMGVAMKIPVGIRMMLLMFSFPQMADVLLWEHTHTINMLRC